MFTRLLPKLSSVRHFSNNLHTNKMIDVNVNLTIGSIMFIISNVIYATHRSAKNDRDNIFVKTVSIFCGNLTDKNVHHVNGYVRYTTFWGGFPLTCVALVCIEDE